MFKYIVILTLIFHYGHGHTYHTGECPSVSPQPDFDMKQVSVFSMETKKTNKKS